MTQPIIISSDDTFERDPRRVNFENLPADVRHRLMQLAQAAQGVENLPEESPIESVVVPAFEPVVQTQPVEVEPVYQAPLFEQVEQTLQASDSNVPLRPGAQIDPEHVDDIRQLVQSAYEEAA